MKGSDVGHHGPRNVNRREEKELGEIAAEHNLNPNMACNWKREFLENAETVFENPGKLEKNAGLRRRMAVGHVGGHPSTGPAHR